MIMIQISRIIKTKIAFLGTGTVSMNFVEQIWLVLLLSFVSIPYGEKGTFVCKL